MHSNFHIFIKIVVSVAIGIYVSLSFILLARIIELEIYASEERQKVFVPRIILNDVFEQQNFIKEKQLINQYFETIKYNKAKQDAVEKAKSSLKAYNSPMIEYLDLIYDRSIECGGDFFTILAIAGIESGFGKIPYRQYNPYGYLNNVTYSGWEEALYELTCKISQEFIAPCNNDLYCIINKYGGSDTKKDFWVKNVELFIKNLKHE